VDCDRNLLFGVLALQADLLTPARFAEACSAWAARKETPLADLLVERGWLTPSDRADVEKLLQRKLAKHQGDAQAGLAEVTTDQVRRSLAGLDDPDVHRSLTPPPAGHATVQTTDYVPVARERYSLSRLHATGGIGRVWLARDASLCRDVALKELRPERAGQPTVSARFVREAQVTGQLEHPGIVPVYELGRRPADDAPFYTMRFVRGRTLAEAARAYHERRRRGEAGPAVLRELVTALVGVCNAVAYAHSRGVLHRDLKPQNVVLGDFGEVIVLDWGLAKMVGAAEGEATPVAIESAGDDTGERTVAGQVLGTPAYMAPEQAEGRLDLLDARTDVYGLGAVLYEVLAGRAPFAGPDNAAVLRRVVHEPPAPPRSAVPGTPRALEAVCLKALAKRPADRYALAKELAEELQRWLADEPVTAYRDPLTTRLTRWGRRRRTLATAVVMALVAGAAGATFGLVRAANAAESERLAKIDAQTKEAEANAVVQYFQDKVFAAGRPKGKPGGLGRDVSLLDAVRAGLPGLGTSFADKPLAEARLRHAIGGTLLTLGEFAEAKEQEERARELYVLHRGPEDPETLRTMHNLGSIYRELGRHEEALKIREETLAAQKRVLGPEHPETLRTMHSLAICYERLDRREEALKLREETLAAMRRVLGRENEYALQAATGLANGYASVGRRDEAFQLRKEVLDDQKRVLGRDHPDVLLGMHNLAEGYAVRGRHDEAVRTYVETIAAKRRVLGPKHPSTLRTMGRLAVSYAALGRYGDALRLADGVLDEADRPGVVPAELSAVIAVRAMCFRKRGDLANCRAAAEFLEKRNPKGAVMLYNAARCRALVAAAQAEAAAPDAARRAREEADRAMNWLKKAVAAGLANAAGIRTDPALDVLRDREDFRKLQAGLEAKAGAGRAAARPPRAKE
jgi:tetratricopeptide (TPR) repeat protein/tRNA A-37 threonylcarbamoyl transferase component Bud32